MTALTQTPATLPAAVHTEEYLQSIAGFTSGGNPTYSYNLSAQSGADAWAVSSLGVVDGMPVPPNTRVDSFGNYRIDTFGNLRIGT
jgi:hypothetical protein